MDYKTNNFMKTTMTDMLSLFFIFLFAFLFTFNNIFEGDTLWHLKLGQYIVSTHHLPYKDIFSYTIAGTRIYPVEWLFEVVWFFIYKASGVAGLITVKAIIGGLTAGFLYFSLQHYKINRYVSILLISGIYIISSGSHSFVTAAGSYFVDRPQIITYLGIALFVYITSIYDIDKKKTSWLIPLIMLVWVNMHPGAVFGMIFLSAWLMEGFIDLLKPHGKSKVFYRRLIVFFLSLFATVITPNSYHLYTFLFHHVASLGSEGGLEYIAEFMPPSLSQTPSMFIGLIVFTVIFLTGIFKMPLRYVFFGLVMLPLSFDMRRMVIMALIGIVCGIGSTVDVWIRWVKEHRNGHWFLIPFYAFVLVGLFTYEVYQYKTDFIGFKGIGIQKQFYPEEAIDFILRHHIQGNIYNAINFGGAVIFLGYPEIKDFIDTRLDPERFLLPEVSQSMNNPPAFDNLLDRYDVSYALVETYMPTDYTRLLPAPEWSLVYFDDYAQIYVKAGTDNDGLIKEYAYHVFNPYSFLFTVAPLLSPGTYFTKPGLLIDVQKLVKEVPYSAMANLAYGLALIYNHADYAGGLKYIDAAKRIMPFNPRILLWYGIEHGLDGNSRLMQESFNLLNTVLKYQEGASVKDVAFMNYVMGYYYYVAGLNKPAITSLKRAVKLNPDMTQASSLLNTIQ